MYDYTKVGFILMVNIDKIKALAKEKGISLTYLCRSVGQGRGYLNDVKSGKTTMPADRLNIIAEKLGTTTRYLADEDDVKTLRTEEELYALNNVFFSIAKEAEESGLDPEDIKAAIEIFKKYRK